MTYRKDQERPIKKPTNGQGSLNEGVIWPAERSTEDYWESYASSRAASAKTHTEWATEMSRESYQMAYREVYREVREIFTG